jgi:benzoyl-CoA 2,3-dioxygenase component A
MECGLGAISHDERNYVVDPDKCEHCLQCLEVCSTGAIDAWLVQPGRAYSIDEQLAWNSLPQPPLHADNAELQSLLSDDASDPATGWQHWAPPCAESPRVNLYSAHAPATATLVLTRRVAAGNDVRHIVLDFGDVDFPVLEGQTIGILAPGTDAEGRPHAMRAYSVASARDGEQAGTNTIALTVKRVVEDYDGRPVRGVCSNYLCDLDVGDRVQVVGPFGQSFLPPDAPGTKLLMICTGTGIAPMRGMIERRCRNPIDDGGDLILFYGARTPADMPYHDEFAVVAPSRLDLNLAFSRVVGRTREYVQDLLARRSDRVLELLLDEDCYIYLCGVRGMEEAVLQTFAEICRGADRDWPQLEQALRASRRLHIETY